MLLLSGFILVSAFFEVLSLASVLPFLGILTAPQRVMAYPGVANLMSALGIGSAEDLVLPFAVSFGAAAILAGAFRILVLWITTKIAYAAGSDFSRDVFRKSLYQPYWVHVASNSRM